jgi:flagellar L-ring protein precursor FlgH
MMKMYRELFFLVFFLILASCAELFKREEPQKLAPNIIPQKEIIKFSENPNIGAFNDKKYRRSTRKTLEDENEVHSRAGSLWNTEGQGAFLFTQNKARREGDLLSVKLEGAGKSQVETKIKIIKKLLARLEIPIISPPSPEAKPLEEQRGPASVKTNTSGDAAGKNKEELKASDSNSQAKSALSGPNNSAEDDAPIQVETVPTRVVERLVDGNYRVKGVQPFMIGKREYKVIVTGFVRPEDFSDEGVSSNKLLDPQWDVVSLRRVQ